MICALQLDDITALDAVKQIQSHGLHMPVILLAETGVEDIALHCLEVGVDQYIPPAPHGFQRLPALVQTLSDRAASARKRLQMKNELKQSRDRYLDVFTN
jgi:DNA-binding response OmpR family regulator